MIVVLYNCNTMTGKLPPLGNGKESLFPSDVRTSSANSGEAADVLGTGTGSPHTKQKDNDRAKSHVSRWPRHSSGHRRKAAAMTAKGQTFQNINEK